MFSRIGRLFEVECCNYCTLLLNGSLAQRVHVRYTTVQGELCIIHSIKRIS